MPVKSSPPAHAPMQQGPLLESDTHSSVTDVDSRPDSTGPSSEAAVSNEAVCSSLLAIIGLSRERCKVLDSTLNNPKQFSATFRDGIGIGLSLNSAGRG